MTPTPIEPATVTVTEDALLISVPLASLVAWAKDLWEVDGLGLTIYDVQAFAGGIKESIEKEDENGNWPLHLMLDQAISDATEDGVPGVEDRLDDQEQTNG